MQLTAVSNIPQFDCHVVAARSQQPSVRAEGNALHPSLVTCQCTQLASVTYIPNSDRIIGTRGSQEPVIKTQRHRVNFHRMANPQNKFGSLNRGSTCRNLRRGAFEW